MKMILIQPKQNKFTAYHFDGTRESALSFIEKWGCVMSIVNDNQYKLTLTDGRDIMPNDYVVINDGYKKIYKQDEFVRRFDVMYDSHRYNDLNALGNFLSDD